MNYQWLFSIGFQLIFWLAILLIFLGQLKATIKNYDEMIREIKKHLSVLNDEVGDIRERLARIEGLLNKK